MSLQDLGLSTRCINSIMRCAGAPKEKTVKGLLLMSSYDFTGHSRVARKQIAEAVLACQRITNTPHLQTVMDVYNQNAGKDIAPYTFLHQVNRAAYSEYQEEIHNRKPSLDDRIAGAAPRVEKASALTEPSGKDIPARRKRKETLTMMNYRLTYSGPAGYDYKGFHTDKEALLWAAHQERLGLIKAFDLMKYDSFKDEYKVISDLRGKPVEVDLPRAGQNKQYYLTYRQDNNYHAILVEAPSVKAAERYFQNKKPNARIATGTREAFPGDMKPGIPELALTEKEERKLRDDFLSSSIEDLDLTVRAYKCLRQAGIQTILDLVCMTAEDLKQLPNLGWKSYDEIVSVLDAQGESLVSEPGPSRKMSLDSRIRSAAHYAENETVRNAVLDSDKLRNMTLDACENIPGYTLLPRKDQVKLYDMVKKAASISLSKSKGPERE